jgi:hypothetical protein
LDFLESQANLVRLAQTDGIIVSILFGAVYFVGGLGGLVWIFGAEKAADKVQIADFAEE